MESFWQSRVVPTFQHWAAVFLSVTVLAIFGFAQMPNAGPGWRPFGHNVGPTLQNERDVNSNGAIQCVVEDMQRRRLRDISIQVRQVSNPSISVTGFTDSAGSVTFAHLPPGQYQLVASQGVSMASGETHIDGFPVTMVLKLPVGSSAYDVAGTQSMISARRLLVPRKADKEFEKAKTAFRKGDRTATRDHLEKALLIYPSFGDALTLRGILNANEAKLDAGCVDLQEAIRYDPSSALAYVALASIYNDLRRYKEARQTVTYGLTLAPRYWRGYFEAARADVGVRDFKSALAQIKRAEDSAPRSFTPLLLTKAYALTGAGDNPSAIAILESILTAHATGLFSDNARRFLARLRAQSVPPQ